MAKKTPTVKITSVDDADRALQRIGELRREIVAAELVANEKINVILDRLKSDSEPFRDALVENEAALEAWADLKKNLFGGPRSIELNWGRVGFRLTPWRIVTIGKLKVATVIEKIRAAKLPLIRKKEEIDKEKALNYSAEDLARCGLKKQQSDEFFYEVKEVEVK